MSSVALAATLSVVVLMASMASVELGLSVAILELLGGVVAGNVLGVTSQPWLDFIASFASVALTFWPGRSRRRPAPARVAAVRRDRPDLVLRAVRRRPGRGLLAPRLDREGERHRRDRPLHDVPRRGLRGAGRDRPEPRPGREAPHVG